MVKILKQLQEIVYSLRSNSGMWREEPVGLIASIKTNEENIEKLKMIIGILLASDKFNEVSKIFIQNRKISIKSANEILNETDKELGMSYPYSTIKINEDENKIKVCLGNNFLRDIAYNINMTSEEYNKRIKNLIGEFGSFEKCRSNLDIYVDNCLVERDNKYKGNEYFFEILRSIECYLIQRKKIVEEYINKDKEFVGYFNYLLSDAGALDNSVIKDRQKLLLFLDNKSIDEESDWSDIT